MNTNMQKSYTHIINLEFDAAIELLAHEQLRNPENAFIHLHYNYIDFLTILIGEEYAFFKSAEKNKALRIEYLKNNDELSPYYLYCQAEIHLQWAFARLKFREYPIATYEFVKAYKLLEENSKLFPDFTLNKKGLGVIYSLLSAVPTKYNWILSLAGLQSNIEFGLSELDKILSDRKFKIYENEILFLLSFLQINLTNETVIFQKQLDRIGHKYKKNHLLNFAAARLAHKLGDNDYCLSILQDRPSKNNKFPFYYLDYLQGMAHLYRLEYELSKSFFNRFVKNFKGNNYIKSAYHKLAWISYLQENYAEKDAYFNKVITEGDALIDEDKVSLRSAESKNISADILLKTRLLFDGGYYLKALLEINKFEILNCPTIFHLEYWYRLARIKSSLGYKNNEVIENYKKSCSLYKGSTSYYGPMSALQIGLIYEKENKVKQAISYFEKCLSFKGFDYERGIHQKAKAGLDRLAN